MALDIRNRRILTQTGESFEISASYQTALVIGPYERSAISPLEGVPVRLNPLRRNWGMSGLKEVSEFLALARSPSCELLPFEPFRLACHIESFPYFFGLLVVLERLATSLLLRILGFKWFVPRLRNRVQCHGYAHSFL